jgi:Na+/H+ antiporter NhaD/arsenite permease-like protein
MIIKVIFLNNNNNMEDKVTDKIIAVTIFILTYVLLISLPKKRAYVALISALIFITIGILPVSKVFSSIDWNVILMIAGTMGIVALFIESKMPALLADLIIERTPNVKWAIIALSLFAGMISALVDNVATVLMVAPVALTIAKKLKISPVPSIIAISIASNLQGAATLVGDTTSILLGSKANMTFLDFFFYQGKISLFWIVQVGAIVATLVLLFVFRNEKQKISTFEKTEVEDYFPTILLLGMVLLLIIASFFSDLPKAINDNKNGIICATLFLIGLIRSFIKAKDINVIPKYLKEIDFFTILLLIGLFVIISSITEVGLVNDIGKFIADVSGGNVFVTYTIIVWASVLFSAFIDNIPYTLTMLSVAQTISISLGIGPTLLYFGLLIGATLGGNITPIGASANITGLGILRRDGYEVSAGQFMKISVPYTLAAVTSGYLLVWLIWS